MSIRVKGGHLDLWDAPDHVLLLSDNVFSIAVVSGRKCAFAKDRRTGAGQKLDKDM